jgi:hypothetical protein
MTHRPLNSLGYELCSELKTWLTITNCYSHLTTSLQGSIQTQMVHVTCETEIIILVDPIITQNKGSLAAHISLNALVKVLVMQIKVTMVSHTSVSLQGTSTYLSDYAWVVLYRM